MRTVETTSGASNFSLSPVSDASETTSVVIPDAHFLFRADFKRTGSDLTLTGEDGQRVVVPDYFRNEHLPSLVTPEGAALTGDVVQALAGPQAPGQYAQAGAPVAGAEAIGRVATVSGSATAIRNGVAVTLNAGDVVLKGDIVQTQSNSAIGVVFTDGTTFNLTSNARMVLNEFVYSPGGTANSSFINLVQGSITFIAGEVAKTGDMKVGTPVAVMGIRGTAVQVDIDVGGTGQTKMSVLVEPGNRVGSFNVFSLSGQLIGTVSNAGFAVVVSPTGPLQAALSEVIKTPAELAQALVAVQLAVQTQAVGNALNAANPPGPAPGPGQGNQPPTNDPNTPTDRQTTGPTTQIAAADGTAAVIAVKVVNNTAVVVSDTVPPVDAVKPLPVIAVQPPAPPLPPVLPPPTPVVNTNPSITGGTFVPLVKGAEVVVTAANLQAVDAENSASQLTYTVLRSSHGHLTLSGVTLNNGAQFTQAQIDAGLVRFAANNNTYVGGASVTVSLSDGVAGSTPAVVTLDSTIFDLQVNVLTPAGINLNNGEDPIAQIGAGDVQSGHTATSFRIVNLGANRDFVFTGTGFVYDNVGGEITLIGGTITSFLVLTHGLQQELYRFTLQISGADWYDVVKSYAAGNRAPFEALTSGWTISAIGGSGSDFLGTGKASDRFVGNAGNDLFEGGAGLDRASYPTGTGGINVQLAAGTVTGNASIGVDTLRSIEFVTGTNFADIFNATGFSAMSANSGSIIPGAGSAGTFNEFEGRGGNDTITGNGNTRVSYLHSTGSVLVDLAAGYGQGNDSVGHDTFTGGVNGVRGSNYGDLLLGSNNAANTSEQFEGRGGNDFIDGRGGFDRASYLNENSGISIQLAAGIVTGGVDTGTDTLRSVEAITGTEFSDAYNAVGFSTSSTNAATGGVNNAGIAFNEFEGRGGNDTIAGNGNTRVAFYGATAGVLAVLTTNGAGSAQGNASVGFDVFSGGVTALNGSDFNDVFRGGDGNDVLIGRFGNDSLFGDIGNDRMTGGSGTGFDGTGSDIFRYDVVGSGAVNNNDTITDFNHSDGDRIDIRHATFNIELATVLSHATQVGANTVINFGNISGVSNTLTLLNVQKNDLQASDFIFANQISVAVQTADGYDFSTLYDDMAGAAVASSLNESDHMFVVNAVKGITFELRGSGFTYVGGVPTGGTITYIAILGTDDLALLNPPTQDLVLVNTDGWNISATDLFAAIGVYAGSGGANHAALDAIFGTPSYNVVGSSGAMFEDAAPSYGEDIFVAGNAQDVFNGLGGPFGPFGPDSDTVSYHNAGSGLVASLIVPVDNTGAAAGDTYISIENLRGSSYNDVLRGDGHDNVLEGDYGDDVLDGWSGSDTASYEHAEAAVTVSLVGGWQNTLGAGIDMLVDIENLRGSDYADTLTGNGFAKLEGGGDGDHLIGTGAGQDYASYEHAKAGVVANLANPGQNTGDADGDSYTNINNLFGSAFTDHLIGNNNNNVLHSGFGSGGTENPDVLTGAGGADTFVFVGAPMTITDFSGAQGDLIDLQNQFGMTESALANLIASSTGNSIDFGPSRITFANIANVSQELNTGDFILHGTGQAVAWSNASDGSWDTAANWNDGFVPLSTNDVIIGRLDVTVDAANASRTIRSLDVSNGATLIVNDIEFTGGAFSNATDSLVYSEDDLSISGSLASLDNEGELSADGTLWIDVSIDGDFTNSGSVSAGSEETIGTGTIVTLGDILIGGEIDGSFVNSGEMTANQDIVISGLIAGNFSNAQGASIEADGNVTIGETGEIGGNFNNSGLLYAGDLLTIEAPITGTFINSSTGEIDVGTLNIDSGVGQTFENSGLVIVSGSSISSIGVIVDNNATGEFDISGGQLSLADTLNNAGSFQVSGTGTAANLYGDVHNLAGGEIHVLDEAFLTFGGMVDGPGTFLIEGGTMDLNNGAESDVTVTFASATEDTLFIGDVSQFHGHLSGFGLGDVIYLSGLDYAGLQSVEYDTDTGILNLTVGGDAFSLVFDFDDRPGNFTLQSDGGGGLRIGFMDVPGSPVDWLSTGSPYGIAFEVSGYDSDDVLVDLDDGELPSHGTEFGHTYPANSSTATITIDLAGEVTTYTVIAAEDTADADTFVTGTSGDNVLIGNPNAANNTFDGGAGDDILYAAVNSDVEDTFVFNLGGGHDRIVGFDTLEDRLDFASFGIGGDVGEFLESNAVDTANGTLITLDPATTVLVQGVLKANIDASHIITGYT